MRLTLKECFKVIWLHLPDIEAWVLESLNETDTFVTEQGDIEDWKNNNTKFKKEVLGKLQEYLKNLKSNIDS